MQNNIGTMQPFDSGGDPHGISQRWQRWRRSFKLYLTAKGTTEDSSKKALLLFTAGVKERKGNVILVAESDIFPEIRCAQQEVNDAQNAEEWDISKFDVVNFEVNLHGNKDIMSNAETNRE
ncbi:uncharacterized protein LOC144431198 [Styela clava]